MTKKKQYGILKLIDIKFLKIFGGFMNLRFLIVFMLTMILCVLMSACDAQASFDKVMSFDFAGLFVVVSAVLAAISGLLVWIGDKVGNAGWGKAAEWIGKITGWIGKGIGLLNSFKTSGKSTDKTV